MLAIARFVKIAMLTTILVMSAPCLISGLNNVNAKISAECAKTVESPAVTGYCESSEIPQIINLSGYCLANKITTENGCVKIVRETNGDEHVAHSTEPIPLKTAYAKNIELEE